MKLTKSFYEKPTTKIAKQLLGKIIVFNKNNLSFQGKIVETEAYLGEKDKACHSHKGKTKRSQIMYGESGRAYIYLCYGIHKMFNIVTGNINIAEAVLIRSVEPIKGLKENKKNYKLTNGPGKWTKTFGITMDYNGHNLVSDSLYIKDQSLINKDKIIKKPRVGIEYAKEWKDKLLRFYIKDNPYVSIK